MTSENLFCEYIHACEAHNITEECLCASKRNIKDNDFFSTVYSSKQYP